MRRWTFDGAGDDSSLEPRRYHYKGTCKRCGRAVLVSPTQVAGEICRGCILPAAIEWAKRCGGGLTVNGTCSA